MSTYQLVDSDMPNDTASQIIDASEVLMKQHGYHGFSYADIAERVGIRKASVHHHFSGKADLAAACVQRYREQIGLALVRITSEAATPADRLSAFGEIFRGALAGEGAMCLCAALSADWESLPTPVQTEVGAYWTDTRAWLATALWHDTDTPTDRQRAARANAVVSLLEGALLCARTDGSEQPLIDAIDAAAMLLG